MNIKIRDKIITSISMYLVLFMIFIYYYRLGSLEKYAGFLTIGLLMMIIKDIMLFFIDFEKVTTIKNSMNKLQKNYLAGHISFGDYYIFINRNYFFPSILIFYLVFILLRQIDLLDFIGDSMYTLMNTNILGLVVVSGVMTTFREEVDKTYQRKVKSYDGLYKNLIINSILSILGAFVILIQTVDLGMLSYFIGLIAGILIFLVGVSIMEEEEG